MNINRQRQHIILTFAFCLTGLCLLQSCSDKEQNHAQLTVTIEPLRYFTQFIAGDKFQVSSMVPQGSSPETYDPVPQQLINLANSKAYFRIGYIGFEQNWMSRLQKNTPQMKVFDTSAGIKTIHTHHIHADHGHEPFSDIDPHIWNSTVNARIIADNVYKGLCEIDPKNKNYFFRNKNKLIDEISKTERIITQLTKDTKNRSFLIFHPALSYFSRDYGFRQNCIEEEGKEPSPIQLRQLIAKCKAENIKVIFIQEEFDKRNAELIAKETNIKLVAINPLSYEWSKEMIHIAKTLSHE